MLQTYRRSVAQFFSIVGLLLFIATFSMDLKHSSASDRHMYEGSSSGTPQALELGEGSTANVGT